MAGEWAEWIGGVIGFSLNDTLNTNWEGLGLPSLCAVS